MDNFVTIVLTNLTKRITRSFSFLESLKGTKRELCLSTMDKFVAIVLTSLTTRITQSFSCLESLKRDEKKTLEVLFRKIISQV